VMLTNRGRSSGESNQIEKTLPRSSVVHGSSNMKASFCLRDKNIVVLIKICMLYSPTTGLGYV
jgi:hypothetical protein